MCLQQVSCSCCANNLGLVFHQCQVLHHVEHTYAIQPNECIGDPMCAKPYLSPLLAHILIATYLSPHSYCNMTRTCQASLLAYNPHMLHCWSMYASIAFFLLSEAYLNHAMCHSCTPWYYTYNCTTLMTWHPCMFAGKAHHHTLSKNPCHAFGVA